MCFLLSARVSCLLYSSHMVARPPVAPRAPSRVCAPSRARGLPPRPAFPALIPPGALCPGRRKSPVASTSWGHPPFKSCPAFALRQAPPSRPLLRPVPALASRWTSHSFATTLAPGLTGSRSCLALPISPPNTRYCFGLAFYFPRMALPSPCFLFCPRIPSFPLSFSLLFGVSH